MTADRQQPRLTVAQGQAQDIPDDPQLLAEDIERTRRHVGDAVEALMAKLDMKAQAKEMAGELKGRIKDAGTTAGNRLRTGTAQAARTAGEQRAAIAVAAGTVLLLGAWLSWVIKRR